MRVSARSGSLVVSRCSARPGSSRPRRRPEGCCTAFQSSIVTPIETTATSAPVTVGVMMLGASTVEDRGDGNRERGEVRAAAGREAARPHLAGPRCRERACLGRRDRAMLGAVQPQRASAEEPEDDQRCREHSGRELEPARQRDEDRAASGARREGRGAREGGRPRVRGRAAPSRPPAASGRAGAESGRRQRAGSASCPRAAHRRSSRTPSSAR